MSNQSSLLLTENNINVNSVGILKLNSIGLVEIDFEPISKLLEQEFESLSVQLKSEETDPFEVLEFVKNDDELNVLVKPYNYCKKFDSTYQGLKENANGLIKKYEKWRENHRTAKDISTRIKYNLLTDYTDRLQAYKLEKTYELCEVKLKEGKVLAYSHRRVGWSNKPYQLNPDFSIHLKTNFGYGSVSYFYVRLQFKGLDIIAFHDWVLYRDARCYEVVKYTKSFDLKNECWLGAMEYTRDACNLSLTDENAFIDKYIVQECERLVSSLESITIVDEFLVYSWERKLVTHKILGHKLVEFRGQKLSGALDFLDKILQFSTLVDISGFINRIEACNKQIQPILEKEIPLVEQKLNDLIAAFIILEKQFEDFKKKKEVFENKRTKFKEFMIDIGELSPHMFNYKKFAERFNVLFPDYESFSESYTQKHNEFHSLTREVESFQTILKNLEECNERIKEYFRVSSIN